MSDSTDPVRLSSPSAVLGFLSGLLYAGAVYGYAHALGYPVLELENPMVLYPIVLLVTAGTIPAFAFVRRRLVTPVLVLAAATYLGSVRKQTASAAPVIPSSDFLESSRSGLA